MLAQRGVAHEAIVAGRGPEMTRLGAPDGSNADGQDHQRLHFACGYRTAVPIRHRGRLALQGCHRRAACLHPPTEMRVRSSPAPPVAFPTSLRTASTGFLVPPGDAAALADALERVLTSKPLTATLSDGARQTAAGPLNWDRIAEGPVADRITEARGPYRELIATALRTF